MGYGLELVSAAATEPITLGELRMRLRMTQTLDDHELSTVHIPAARRYMEARLGRAIVTQTWKVTLDSFPRAANFYTESAPESFLVSGGIGTGWAVIEVPLNPVVSVTTVKYYDANNVLQTLSSTLYQLDKTRSPARLVPTYGNFWPVTYLRLAAVEITVVVGDGAAIAADPLIRAACLFLAEDYYKGLDGVNATVERLLDLAWDGTRHGPQKQLETARYPGSDLGAAGY